MRYSVIAFSALIAGICKYSGADELSSCLGLVLAKVLKFPIASGQQYGTKTIGL